MTVFPRKRTLGNPAEKASLIRRLHDLRPDSHRRWGHMTVHQMVCHLADATRVALGEMTVSVYTPWWARTLTKWVALGTPLPWPSGLPTRPELDQVRGAGTKPKDLARDVAELEELVERMAAPDTDLEGHVHPIFGHLSSADWLKWAYLHTDHHLRQFGV